MDMNWLQKEDKIKTYKITFNSLQHIQLEKETERRNLAEYKRMKQTCARNIEKGKFVS